MPHTTDPESLKDTLASGLLAFPVTHFTSDGKFNEAPYRGHIGDLLTYEPAGFFAAGGTGEFFSLTLQEFGRVIAAAIAAVGRTVPVIGGTGYGTEMAIEFARSAQAAGADGVLVLPHYLLHVEQEGLYRHVSAICRSVDIGVIVYNRDNSIFSVETLERLADACANLVGFKDGAGNIEHLVSVRQRLGHRLVYVGGMPTAEVFAVPYKGIGFSTYSSAVFNFLPRVARRFFDAVRTDDREATDGLLRDFFLPYLALRNRRRGYAVSIIKAGMRLTGRAAGPVRPPLVDLDAAEEAELAILIRNVLGKAIR
jgi:5-dehydro-4-deoxyglucarate dehydratase